MIVRADRLAVLRTESKVYLPNPPGCYLRGCISGPRPRGHLQRLQAQLGWLSVLSDEDMCWVPLLLH